MRISNGYQLFWKLEYLTNTDNDYGKNTDISVRYRLLIPIIHCIGQIVMYTDTESLSDQNLYLLIITSILIIRLAL